MAQRLFMNAFARSARANDQNIDRSRIKRPQQLGRQTALQIEEMLRLGRQFDQQIDVAAARRVVHTRSEQAHPRTCAPEPSRRAMIPREVVGDAA